MHGVQGPLFMVSHAGPSAEAVLWMAMTERLCGTQVPSGTPRNRAHSGERIVGSNLGVKILTHFCIFNVVSFLNSRQITTYRQIGL